MLSKGIRVLGRSEVGVHVENPDTFDFGLRYHFGMFLNSKLEDMRLDGCF